MYDVFISYSRKDIDFARELKEKLEEAEFSVWIDLRDIPPTMEWLQEIYTGIEAADNFMFILSPDSVISEWCEKELAHAITYKKRLVPIIYREVESGKVPIELGKLQIISFRESDDFNDCNLTDKFAKTGRYASEKETGEDMGH